MDYLDLQSNPEAFENFWYKGRRNLIKVLWKKYGIENKKILEVGCGAGSQLLALRDANNTVSGSDINENALAVARHNGQNVFLQDIENDIAEEKFDVICAFDVLEHVNNDEKAINNIVYMLNTDGTAFFTVPAYQFLFSSHDKHMKHCRRYSKKELEQILLNSGFTNIKLFYWNSVLFLPMAITRIIDKNKKPKSDINKVPKFFNSFFYGILAFENWLIQNRIKFPFGLSIVAIVKK